jgi:hypothetical protein
MRLFLASVASSLAVLAASPIATAQVALQPSGAATEKTTLTPEQRVAELKAVVASITTPDRDLNIAHFEQLMESADARRIEIAIRTLVSGDDPVLRGMAMRGYIAVTRQLVLDVALSPQEMKVLQEARAQPDGVRRLRSPNEHLSHLNQYGFKFNFTFEVPSIKEPRGKVVATSMAGNASYWRAFAVRGERITFTANAANGGPVCEFELTPKKDTTIAGTMTCPSSSGIGRPIALIARMF